MQADGRGHAHRAWVGPPELRSTESAVLCKGCGQGGTFSGKIIVAALALEAPFGFRDAEDRLDEFDLVGLVEAAKEGVEAVAAAYEKLGEDASEALDVAR